MSRRYVTGTGMTRRESQNQSRRRNYPKRRETERIANMTYRHLHPEITAFKGMGQRCNNANDPRYADYGGRNIKRIFTSWHDIVEDIGERPSSAYSIDRINNDGNYEKGNIRWATQSQQANNRRLS